MPLFLDQGVFSLVVAVGVSGLVRVMSRTQVWLDELATQFAEWPHSHRTRSIRFVVGRELTLPAGLEIESAY